jgi:hypothetical protein
MNDLIEDVRELIKSTLTKENASSECKEKEGDEVIDCNEKEVDKLIECITKDHNSDEIKTILNTLKMIEICKIKAKKLID